MQDRLSLPFDLLFLFRDNYANEKCQIAGEKAILCEEVIFWTPVDASAVVSKPSPHGVQSQIYRSISQDSPSTKPKTFPQTHENILAIVARMPLNGGKIQSKCKRAIEAFKSGN
jgi:hypothetical protein